MSSDNKNTGLDETAFELKPGQEYVPYVTQDDLAEGTVKSVISGVLLGVMFGAANAYLGLMAGLTISTSIPIAVLTVVVFASLRAGSWPGRRSDLRPSPATRAALGWDRFPK